MPQSSKPWYKSLTAWPLILLAVLGGVEQAGGVPPGTTDEASRGVGSIVEQFDGILVTVASLLSLFGRVRAAGPLTARAAR